MKITRGVKSRPQKVVIYGPEGVGKTTLAADLPEPLFIDAEGGTDHMDVPRIEVASMQEIREAIAFIRSQPGEFKTVVFDTIDWIEKRLARELCEKYGKDSLEKIEGGFGKGYNILAEQLLQFLDGELEGLIKAGFNVVLLAHAKVEKHEDPELSAAYDRFTLKMEKKTAPLVKEWADALLFYRFKMSTAERDSGKHRGVSRGRQLATTRSAAFDAKNRHSLPETIEIAADDQHPGAKLDAIFRMAPELSVATPPAETAPAAAAPTNDDDEIPGLAAPSREDRLAALIDEAGGQAALNAYLASSRKIWDAELQDKALKNKSAFIAKVREFQPKEAA